MPDPIDILIKLCNNLLNKEDIKMPKTLSVYPSDNARMICGGGSPGCNRAIECWAMTLRQSQPDLTREEWNFLADVLNGTLDEISMMMVESGSAAMCLEVHDAQELNKTGDKWFDDGQKATDALIKKLQSFDWLKIQYIVTAVNFFWNNPDIDHLKDEWWTVSFRVQWLSK